MTVLHLRRKGWCDAATDHSALLREREPQGYEFIIRNRACAYVGEVRCKLPMGGTFTASSCCFHVGISIFEK